MVLTEIQNFLNDTYLNLTVGFYVRFIYHYRNMDSGI